MGVRACSMEAPGGCCARTRRHSPLSPTGDKPSVSCCASSEGRCCDSVEARHFGCVQLDQRVAQGVRLAGHGLDLAFAVLVLIGIETLLDRGAAMFSQAVDQPGELVRCRRDGLGGAQAAPQPPKEGPQGRARVVDRACGEAQGQGDALCARAPAS